MALDLLAEFAHGRGAMILGVRQDDLWEAGHAFPHLAAAKSKMSLRHGRRRQQSAAVPVPQFVPFL